MHFEHNIPDFLFNYGLQVFYKGYIMIKFQTDLKVFTENTTREIKEVFGEEDGILLYEEMELLEEEVDDGCIDNYRIVLVGDIEGEKIYQEAVNNGCCGSQDKEVMINGKLYRIGCNFGH